MSNTPDNDKIVIFKKRETSPPSVPSSEPIINLPPVVRGISLFLLGVHTLLFFLPERTSYAAVELMGFTPARFNPLALVTHMALHGGWLHLAINVGTLMAFGTALEKKHGGRRLLVWFFACGIIGALMHFVFFSDIERPLIGASGAISGLFGVVLVSLQQQGAMGSGSGLRQLLPIVLVWIGISLFFGLFGMPGAGGPIAWTTHVGGFVAGLLLYRPVLSRV